MKSKIFLRVCLALGAAASHPAFAQAAHEGQSVATSSLTWQAGIDTQTTLYSMSGAWWSLAAAVNPSFETSRSFSEFWVHPRLNAQYALNSQHQAYAALSAGWSKTVSADAFNNNAQGAVCLENASLGLKGALGADWRYDVSARLCFGRQHAARCRVQQRRQMGGVVSRPCKAWGTRARVKVARGDWTGNVFRLEPSETPASRTYTWVQGASLEWQRDKAGRASLAWLTVPRSSAIYPGDLAPLGMPKAHLSDEMYVQYVHVFTPKLIALGSASGNFPQAGLKAIAPQGTEA